MADPASKPPSTSKSQSTSAEARPGPLDGAGFRGKLWLARLAVAFERLYPALFPALMVIAAFLLASLFDLWAFMPVWLHVLLLLAFAIGLAGCLFRARHAASWPARDRGLARLERDSDARHQPLRVLEDRLPEESRDPVTRSLWQRHRERTLAALRTIRVAPPRSAMPGRDPWAGRALVVLLLAVGLLEARGDIGQRLLRAVTPGSVAAAALPVEVTMWVTPPTYTRRPPLTIEQTGRLDQLDVPTGSEAVIQLHNLARGDDERPEVRFNGEALALETLGEKSGEARLSLDEAGVLEVVPDAGEPLESWRIVTLPDQPPAVAFAETPGQTHRQVLEIAYTAEDDYGVRRVVLNFALVERPSEASSTTLAEPARAPDKLERTTYSDLTAHKLAGLEVEMRLVATDGQGQEGTSEPVRLVLPERVFEHPLARAVIAERKRLVREPQKRREVANGLDRLAEGRLAEEAGTAIQLGLAIAGSRLTQARDAESRESVVELLWELALMIEEGTLSVAERSLREVQEALRRALEEGADESELQELMDELREAMDRFLDELTRQALEQMQNMPENMPMQPVDPSQMVDRQQLQEMLDRAEEMMQGGAREQAQAMLEQLQRMLENMQAGLPQQMQPSPGEQAVSDLQRMIELQQNLLDRSHQMQQRQGEGQEQGQQGQQQGRQQGQEGQQGSGQAAAEQDALRRALGELMRRMGEAGMDIPRALGQAELQMRGARDALGEGQPGQAVPPQGEAIDQMQQAGQAMLEEMREQMANQPGQGQGFGPPIMGAQRDGRDPLGRPQRNEGGWDSDGTEVPQQNDLGRAREVLEELYRRSRDLGRPQHELDYIDRLLDRF